VSNSKKIFLVCLCLILVLGMSFAQKITKLQAVQGDSPYIKGGKPMFAVIPRARSSALAP